MKLSWKFSSIRFSPRISPHISPQLNLIRLAQGVRVANMGCTNSTIGTCKSIRQLNELWRYIHWWGWQGKLGYWWDVCTDISQSWSTLNYLWTICCPPRDQSVNPDALLRRRGVHRRRVHGHPFLAIVELLGAEELRLLVRRGRWLFASRRASIKVSSPRRQAFPAKLLIRGHGRNRKFLDSC